MVVAHTDRRYIQTLTNLLSQNLDFAGKPLKNPLHNFHSFPAKFPPELPRAFILDLTSSSETVLDPMAGSGTTVLEAFLSGRRAVGFDIDPLALLIARVKTSSPDPDRLLDEGLRVLTMAKAALASQHDSLSDALSAKWDTKTRDFVNYWFLPQTQLELIALMLEIDKTSDLETREFLQLTFSSIIITKSGGVSRAMDLGHTRPHRVEVLPDGASQGEGVKYKRVRSAIKDFEKKFNTNLAALRGRPALRDTGKPQIQYANAQQLPLESGSVDLIVTSPPYVSNAIDYMRAHKFSLVWLGFPIERLAEKKAEYIGNRRIKDSDWKLPLFSQAVVSEIAKVDDSKAAALYSYLCEMKLVIGEMLRVLKPGRAAIVVVGDSILRGKNTHTAECLAEIGQAEGFFVPGITRRNIDRNHRMMPVSTEANLDSLVQQRMHQEHVIGFYKPC